MECLGLVRPARKYGAVAHVRKLRLVLTASLACNRLPLTGLPPRSVAG